MNKALALLVALLLSGCATSRTPEPIIQTVTVEKAVPVPCSALAKLGAEPNYPDTAQAIREATTIAQLSKLYAKGRMLRAQRLAEYVVARRACTF